MPLPSELRRRVDDLVDGKHSVLPALAVASRQPTLTQSLWAVQELELARNASHLRAIARQRQALKTNPKPQLQAARNESSIRVSPRLPGATLTPLLHPKCVQAVNNNNVENDPVLQEIWRVAATAAKQQQTKATTENINNVMASSAESTVRRQHRVGNQEDENPSGTGTTLARYRRLVGMYARRTLMRILDKAADNLVRIRLENRCAVCIQRVVRRFLGRCRRARLRFVMVDAVERIERQWKRTKARRLAAMGRREQLKQRRAEEDRLAAARDIQLRYQAFAETKRKKEHEEEVRKLMEQGRQQQHIDAEKRDAAAVGIQRALGKWRRRESQSRRESSHVCYATRQICPADVVTKQPVGARPGDTKALNSPEIAVTTASGGVDDRADVSQASAPLLVEMSHLANAYGHDVAFPQLSQRPSSSLGCSDHDSGDPVAAVKPLESKSSGIHHSDCDQSLASPLTHRRSQHVEDRPSTSTPLLPVSEDADHTDTSPILLNPHECGVAVLPSGTTELEPQPHEITVETTPTVPLAALRHASAIVGRFLSLRCLPHVRGQLLTRHHAVIRVQRLIRCHLARRRVTFQRQLHLLSLRSELQAKWLKSEYVLMASILGDDDTPTEPHHDTTEDDTLSGDDDVGFPSDDEESEDTVSSIGMAWTDVLPTRNGTIPRGLRLDFTSSHGPAASSAPSLGLWKWSWASQHWEPNRNLFMTVSQA